MIHTLTLSLDSTWSYAVYSCTYFKHNTEVLNQLIQFQFHTHQLLLNDIMEGTEMRRGAPCWHRRPDVGLDAVNDATLIQSAMYTTLRKHFGAKPYYKNVLETFNVVSFFPNLK